MPAENELKSDFMAAASADQSVNVVDRLLTDMEKAILTSSERKVLELLRDAWNEFVELEPQMQCDLRDFSRHIHALQNLVGSRVARRLEPDVWRQMDD